MYESEGFVSCSLNLDESNLLQISQGSNAQGETFSPDSTWNAFPAYTDVANKNQARGETYIMPADGTDQRRLTDDGYFDYQPRWGS